MYRCSDCGWNYPAVISGKAYEISDNREAAEQLYRDHRCENDFDSTPA